MTGTLKVTPAKLTSAASEFKAQGNTMKTTVNKMISEVESLSSVWTGSGATAYIKKFKALQSDVNKLVSMCTEHATDLTNMAAEYKTSDASAQQVASGLKTNIIS